MRFQNIEVSGIFTIVINRKAIHHFAGGEWLTQKIEHLEGGAPAPVMERRTHNEMMKIVNILKKDRRYRMWIHADTLNIVRR